MNYLLKSEWPQVSEWAVILNTDYHDHVRRQEFLPQQASRHRCYANHSVQLDHD